MTDQGEMYYAGFANILDMPEFFDIDVTKALLEAIDETGYFQNLCSSLSNANDEEDTHILIEDELGAKLNGPYGFIYTSYETPLHIKGTIGVLGPARLNYTLIIPTVRYFGDLIETSAKGW